jgi:hypothetical protein
VSEIVSVIAAIISLLAVGISVWQVRVAKRTARVTQITALYKTFFESKGIYEAFTKIDQESLEFLDFVKYCGQPKTAVESTNSPEFLKSEAAFTPLFNFMEVLAWMALDSRFDVQSVDLETMFSYQMKVLLSGKHKDPLRTYFKNFGYEKLHELSEKFQARSPSKR